MKNSFNKLKLPLSIVLIVPFLLQILTIVGIIGYFSYKNGEKAVNNLANQLMISIGDRIEENLENYLNIPEKITQSNASLLKLGILNPKDLSTLQTHFWEQMQIFDNASAVMITTENRDFMIVERVKNDLILRIFNQAKQKQENYLLDAQGKQVKMIESYSYDPHNDPPNNPWYQRTKNAKKPIWIHTVSLPTTTLQPIVILAHFQSFYNQKGDFQGVVSSAFHLSDMSKFLSSLNIGKTGEAFIIDNQGLLVATSTEETPFTQQVEANLEKNLQPQKRRKLIVNSENELTKKVAQVLLEKFNNFEKINQFQKLRFDFNNQNYYLTVQPTQQERGLNWLTIIVIPEADFMEEIYKNNLRTVIICLSALIISIILGIITANYIIKPILKLNDAAKQIALGNWYNKIKNNRQDELGELANSFNKMAFQLQEAFENLETKVKQRTQELEKAKEKAEVANQAKSSFIANMSHELRTPLNAILGFSQIMMRSQTLPQEHKENITTIITSGDYLLSLINNILDLAKIEAGKITLNYCNFDLYSFLNEVEDLLHLKAENKGLQLLFEYGNNVPQYIRTDATKLRQVLINLINNGIKFTSEGGVFVKVTRENTPLKEDNKCCLLFTVEDTGVGIPAAEIDKLFEAFVQTESGKQSQEGTGLGLTISRKFVQLMGGEIQVKSEVGKGTIFSFNIQATILNASELETKQNTRDVIALKPGQPHKKILVVDDRSTNRLLLTKLLQPLGFELQEASNGFDAIEKWEKWQPHLIFMDMRMPVMDGYEATQYIKGTIQGNATAIVAVTASVLEEEKAVVLSAGCDDFIRKPFRESEIFESIAKHLGVEYLYAEEQNQQQTKSVKLQPEHLTVMPQEWLERLYNASKALDDDLILKLIEEIPQTNSLLAAQLTHLVDDFKIKEIKQLIESIKG